MEIIVGVVKQVVQRSASHTQEDGVQGHVPTCARVRPMLSFRTQLPNLRKRTEPCPPSAGPDGGQTIFLLLRSTFYVLRSTSTYEERSRV